jgi:precorrin-6B methylase 2
MTTDVATICINATTRLFATFWIYSSICGNVAMIHSLTDRSFRCGSRACCFRAYLPAHSTFRPLLLEQIQMLPHHYISKVEDKYVEFGSTTNEHQRPAPFPAFSLHQLPATKVTIVCQLTFTMEDDTLIFRNAESGDASGIFEEALEGLLEAWSALLGNCPGVPGPQTTFSLATVTSSSTSNRKAKRLAKAGGTPMSTREAFQIAATLRRELSNRFGWIPSGTSSKSVELPFQISSPYIQSLECGTMHTWNLELLALTRIFPLPANRATLPRKSKRLESFVVAKTANIQPNDILLDPRCQRGTILIEAAKYWPLASKFIGMDSNIGHLEHARMNADSTMTCLELHHLPYSGSKAQPLPVEASSIDKIVCCLPFGQSREHYKSLLTAWMTFLKPGGSMTLVVDQLSLESLIQGVHLVSSESNLLYLTFVRNASIEWGNKRATIVQVLHPAAADVEGSTMAAGSNGIPPTRHGITEWEKEKPNDQSFSDFWAMTRLQQTPALVPINRAQLAQGRSNHIILSNLKVYTSS